MRLLDDLLLAVALDDGDRARLAALQPVLAPSFPDIAEAFYAAVRANPETLALLASPAQLERLRATLIEWMASGLTGPYDDAFVASRARIAQRHVELGLDPHHAVTGIGVVRRGYRARIAEAYPADEAAAIGASVDKLLDLELALMVRHDQLAAQARLVASERNRRQTQVEALQTLCAGLAHEVRNPLNSARLQLELALRRARRTGDDAQLAEPIELAQHEIARLTDLLDEFLIFARPPALDLQDHDLAEVARACLAHHRAHADRRRARLSLVATGAPIVAQLDGAKIREVLDKLVCNALEAIGDGGHVVISVERRGDQIHVRVRDDGPGIPPEVLPRIYEPFFTTKETGTGMGMSIAHSLVALHGGTIDVASSGAGTTVDVVLPAG